MELKLNLEFDEEKLQELVAQAVERLKAEGYIWRDDPKPFDWSKLSKNETEA